MNPQPPLPPVSIRAPVTLDAVYKTELCSRWVSGMCPWGDSCRFAVGWNGTASESSGSFPAVGYSGSATLYGDAAYGVFLRTAPPPLETIGRRRVGRPLPNMGPKIYCGAPLRRYHGGKALA